MKYLAHSILDKYGVIIPAQTYKSHVDEVVIIIMRNLSRIKKYVKDVEIYLVIEKAVILAGTYHDLGKLLEQPQKVLNGEIKERMVNHVSAGVVYLLNQYSYNQKLEYLIAAYLIHAHHIGFLNFDKIIERNVKTLTIKYGVKGGFKDKRSCTEFGLDDITVDSYSERNMSKLLEIHNSLIENKIYEEVNQKKALEVLTKFTLLRTCLSILCDADHENTSLNYKEPYPQKSKQLKAKERKQKLIEFIISKTKADTTRNIMRSKFFNICSKAPKENFILIDGTVGIGKTYGGLACILDMAEEYNLDTLNVVLPYIALIEQTTESFREAISFNKKDAEWSISPIHSICESKNLFHRKFYKNFNSPINITTSVNFFNILISNNIPVLKNLHKLIGSAIIMDEYHCYATYEFWPVILSTLNELTTYFEVKVSFCSGSPTEYWNLDYNIPSFNNKINVKGIIPSEFYKEMINLENKRVKLCHMLDDESSFESLYYKVKDTQGSIFIVFTTRKASNRFYKYLVERNLNKKVYLRYSALAPIDREKQFEKIKKDLKNNKDIILVATEGADIGLDISFRHGFKEYSSTNSALQMMGRINRNCECSDSVLFVFKLEKNPDGKGKISGNPALFKAREVFLDNIEEGCPISPEGCTKTAQKELNKLKDKSVKEMLILHNNFEQKAFQDLGDNFKIISMPTIKILVNRKIYNDICSGKFIKWNNIQKNIVTMYNTPNNIEKFGKYLTPVPSQKLEEDKKEDEKTDLFVWDGEYDKENEGIMIDSVFSEFQKTIIV